MSLSPTSLFRRAAIPLFVSIALLAGSSPAAAESLTMNSIYDSYPVTVNGSYTPLVGNFNNCRGGADIAPDVLWYAPGTAADYLWQDLKPSGSELDFTSKPVSINGHYQPFVGDFDMDGCVDIFWYAPGAAPDFIWYFNDDGTYESIQVQVNGNYRPVVGMFGTAVPSIFWYGPGSTPESFWEVAFDSSDGIVRGKFKPRPAPAVNGDYQVSSFAVGGGITGVAFVNLNGQDYAWVGAKVGETTPMDNRAVNFGDGPLQVGYAGGGFLVYRPGPASDVWWTFNSRDDRFQQTPATINGHYRLGTGNALGSSDHPIVFHAPGPAQDFLWMIDYS